MEFNRLIDHTNLSSDASKEDIEKLCTEAQAFKFNSICIRPNWIKEFAPQYKCSAVGSFPKEVFHISSIDEVKNQIGKFSYEEKSDEFKQAQKDGAYEIDPVINLSKLDNLKDELSIYYEAVMESHIGVYLKPIFSCEILTEDELEFTIAKYAEFAKASQYCGIKYCYKNSTGFIKSDNPDLLKTTSVELMTKIKNHLDKYDPWELLTVKAAGGIKNLEDIKTYYGILGERLSHIGTSSGVKIFG